MQKVGRFLKFHQTDRNIALQILPLGVELHAFNRNLMVKQSQPPIETILSRWRWPVCRTCRAPDLQVDLVLNGHDFDVDLPGDDDIRGERCLRRVWDEDAPSSPVSLCPQPGLVAELPRLCSSTHTHNAVALNYRCARCSTNEKWPFTTSYTGREQY